MLLPVTLGQLRRVYVRHCKFRERSEYSPFFLFVISFTKKNQNKTVIITYYYSRRSKIGFARLLVRVRLTVP